MKKYLVKLNRPVLIENSPCDISKLQPVYGFLSPIYDEELFDSYVSYMAAMHEWSAKREKRFDVVDKDWVDRKGNRHYYIDSWAEMICGRNRKKLGLEYSVKPIDLDNIEGVCLNCGIAETSILCESLMNNLWRFAEQQAERPTEGQNVILFNRPIWLPKRLLWKDENSGYCHIYGFVTDRNLDIQLLNDCNIYLGYLAMCEELTLNGTTYSGFTANLEKDGAHWYRRGKEFTCRSEELQAECQLCQKKNNLRFNATTLKAAPDQISNGIRTDFIVSKELYETLMEND